MQGNIEEINWTVYGKIENIRKTDGAYITYTYDASGNRISKGVTKAGTITETWYVRDASGNTMAVYEAIRPTGVQNGNLTQKEVHLYGSSRLGVINYALNCSNGNNGPTPLTAQWDATFTRGDKLFELTNHLGNVLATVTDRRVAVQDGSTTNVDYYLPDVATATDYYPGGMTMPGRSYSSGSSYQYGFNGKRKDNDIYGEGNAYDFGARIQDPRLGRFFSVDRMANRQPYISPYVFAGNKPIWAIDYNGDIEVIVNYIRVDEHWNQTSRHSQKMQVLTQEDLQGISRTPIEINVYDQDVLVELSPNYKYWTVKRVLVGILKNTGEKEDEKLWRTDKWEYIMKKAMVNNPLGLGHLWQAIDGKDYMTGQNLSKVERTLELADAVINALTLGRGGLTGTVKKAVGGWLQDEIVEEVNEKIWKVVNEKFGLDQTQTTKFLYYVGKFVKDAKDGELKSVADFILSAADLGLKGSQFANELKKQTGVDVNLPSDGEAAAKQTIKNLDLKTN